MPTPDLDAVVADVRERPPLGTAQALPHGEQVGQDLHAGRGLEAVELLGEQAEDGEKSPLKAELLTMLLLTLYFGLSVGWLLRNAQRQGALCSLAFVGPSLATACEDLPFLGVFRL